ncbi:MAG TPA: DegV family protein [Actinomycetota bacterium]|nr:DegV family protein [Actinomycetota bacterium]
MTVAVITDSTASLPPDVARAFGITVVPLRITAGGRDVRDGEISAEELLRNGPAKVVTSGPTPGDFLEAIASGTAKDGALIVTVAARFSATYRSALAAARSSAVPTKVLDSGTVASAQGLVAVAAAREAASGADLDAVAKKASGASEDVRLMAALDSLDHLISTGRVPEAAGWLGRRMRVRAVVQLSGGSIHPVRPAFSAEAAEQRILGHWRRSRPRGEVRLHVAALHTLARERAERLLDRIAHESDPEISFVTEFGAAMVAYTGPGVVGLSWRWER